jgi:predicted kinase
MQAVIFTGIQGSGKSTFYRERLFETHVRISMDLLKTRNREQAFLQLCLNTKQPFVVDNTNPRAADRARYIVLARQSGFRVTGYFFDVNLRTALGRNKSRSGRAVIPVPGVIGTWKRQEPPSMAEGFDELYRVSVDNTGQVLVEPYIGPEPKKDEEPQAQ